MSVGAVWRLGKDYIDKIDPGFSADELFVMLSDDGDRWSGYTNVIFNANNLPKVGDPPPHLFQLSVYTKILGMWEKVRQDLINDRLGPPHEGTNPFAKDTKSSPSASNVCTCSLNVIMRDGCPSTHGDVCPSIHD